MYLPLALIKLDIFAFMIRVPFFGVLSCFFLFFSYVCGLVDLGRRVWGGKEWIHSLGVWVLLYTYMVGVAIKLIQKNVSFFVFLSFGDRFRHQPPGKQVKIPSSIYLA